MGIQRTFDAWDKENRHYTLTDAQVMGYLDHPMITLEGYHMGVLRIAPEQLEQLAVAWLRSHGWLVIEYEQIRLTE